MLTSLGFVILGGAALAAVCRKIQLPTIIGLMLAGMRFGTAGGQLARFDHAYHFT